MQIKHMHTVVDMTLPHFHLVTLCLPDISAHTHTYIDTHLFLSMLGCRLAPGGLLLCALELLEALNLNQLSLSMCLNQKRPSCPQQELNRSDAMLYTQATFYIKNNFSRCHVLEVIRNSTYTTVFFINHSLGVS